MLLDTQYIALYKIYVALANGAVRLRVGDEASAKAVQGRVI
jgi:hypothetical protein